MDLNVERKLANYKTQIIFLILVIFATILSLSVVKILIDITQGKTTYKLQQKEILNRSRIAAIIILISAIYFFYDALKTYKKNKSQANFTFFIATLLALIAASLRLINLLYNNVQIYNAEDII